MTACAEIFTENITVDCITFGAPPIAKPPIPQRDNSLFISVINEGDPVPLIEPGYAYTLLKAYVAAKPPQHTHVPIPPRMFALSGTCIVLRDDRRLDAGQSDISAYEAENEHFSQVLFGNFVMHDRARYLSRVSAIAKKKWQFVKFIHAHGLATSSSGSSPYEFIILQLLLLYMASQHSGN